MRNRSQLVFGGAILFFGLILLVGNLFNISLWRFIWPLVLISLGLIMIFRQQKGKGLSKTYYGFARDINRVGSWDIQEGEFWHFAGDFDLDFTDVKIPPGEHVWRLFGFVHEIRLRVPAGTAVSFSSHAFVTEKKVNGDSEDLFLVPFHWKTEGYDNASNKFRIEANGFVVDSRISQVD